MTEYTIAAKFLTKRALNTESVRTFDAIWRSVNGFKVRNVGNHIVLFTFDNEEEVERIYEGEPWSFNKHLVLIKKYDYSIPVRELVFEQESLWVQVHDIPFRYLSRRVAEELCEAVGVVNKNSSDVKVDKGCVMRVRVWVDVSLPLCRGRVISLENSSKGWVSFRYECLPNICYWCRCLSHFDKDCDLWIESKASLTQADQQYGTGIRAAPMSSKKNSIMVVPGFYESKRKEKNASKMYWGNSTPAKQGGAHGASNSETQQQELNAMQSMGSVTTRATNP